MVIIGGFAYLKRKNLNHSVNLTSLAEDCRKETEKIPSLLIDCSRIQFVKYLKTESQCGWDWNALIRKFKNFVLSIKSSGIRPVFYFQENDLEKDKWKYWIKTNNEKIREVFDSVKNEHECSVEFSPPGQSYFRYIIKYECHISDVYTMSENHHVELAFIAKKHENCLGILSMNADYIIFNTKPLFSLKNLHLTSMSTEMYKHTDFANSIGLNYRQLMLLSCLVGNDAIYLDELKAFHERIGYFHEKDKDGDSLLLDIVGDLIKKKNWSAEQSQLSEISEFTGISENVLRKGILYYDNPSKSEKYADEHVTFWSDMSILRRKWKTCEIPPGFLKLLSDRIYIEKASFEDYEDPSLPSCALIYREMRQRMYRILFNGKNVTVKEWCYYKDANLDVPDEVQVHRDTFHGDIPSLKELMSGDEEMKKISWDLLQFCLGTTISYEKIKKLRYSDLSLCFILHYLLKQGVEIEDYELRAFIAQAFIRIDSKKLTIKPTPRIIQLSELLQKGMFNLMYVIAACGFPYFLEHALPWRSFNRKIFAFLQERLFHEPIEYFLKEESEMDYLDELLGIVNNADE